MKIKELIRRAIFYVSVPKCVLCKERLDFEDRGLCKACFVKYIRHKDRNCPKCSKILSECSCSYSNLEAHGIKHFVKIFRYSKAEQSMPSNYLIYSLKQDNRYDVLSFLSDEMVLAIRNSFDTSSGEYVITSVPRRKKAIVSFGYDHAKALAIEVARKLDVEYLELLISKSKRAQKSVFGEERKLNAKFDYRSKKVMSLKGKTVILIDDIVTTGASITNCATLIRGYRPKKIIGACLGTAYKEERVDYDRKYTRS